MGPTDSVPTDNVPTNNVPTNTVPTNIVPREPSPIPGTDPLHPASAAIPDDALVPTASLNPTNPLLPGLAAATPPTEPANLQQVLDTLGANPAAATTAHTPSQNADAVLQSAKNLYSDARGGRFTLEAGTAEHLAKACETLGRALQARKRDALDVVRVNGFGTLPSGVDLKAGFERKGQELRDQLGKHAEAAFRTQAAFLAAGGKYEDADQAIRAAIKASARESGQM